MSKLDGELPDDELRERAFNRIADVLWSFWDEQKNIIPRKAYVHTRLFDVLIHPSLISLGTSTKGTGHIEHVVPCAYIRDKAFEMFRTDDKESVSKMVGRLLRTANITREEARELDHKLGLKTCMPEGWDWMNDSILVRLDAANITLTIDKL